MTRATRQSTLAERYRAWHDPEREVKLQKAIEGKENEVEIELIRQTLLRFGNVDPERLVLEYGRPFAGIPRPKGYRQRRQKECFANSQRVAFQDRGTYCEGFVLSPRGSCFHHGWITLDGTNAIDITLRDNIGCKYFGIPFAEPALKKLIMTINVERRATCSMLADPIDARMVDALGTLRSQGLI
jgi:hypothetical protein